jgi:hypothetical protein
VAASALAADSNPKSEVQAAAKKLGDNYSWKTSVENAGGRGFGGPSEGKTADGKTWVSMSFRENTTEAVLTGGEKGAIKTPDGWRSLAEASQDDGGGFSPGSFAARMLRNYKTPAVQAAELVDQTKSLTKEGDVYSGELTEDGAKALLSFRRGGGGGEGPSVSGATGTVKLWVQGGKLTKYQFQVKGSVSFNGNDRDVDRTTTVELKDVGTTKVEVPEEAKAKLS